jgi:hypothetical protein
MMLIKREPPLGTSFENNVGWHSSMLSLSAVVTSGMLERSAFAVVRHDNSEAVGLQMSHAAKNWLNRRI